MKPESRQLESASERKGLAQLTRDLNKAKAGFLVMQRAVIDLVSEAPSGIPFSAGQLRIVKATQDASAAFAKYQTAVEQYRDFVTRGIIPDA